MARAFHSAYGLKSLVYGRMQLSVTKFSSIMEPTFFADFTEPESFRRHMVEAGRRLTSERPDTTFLLIACGDDYSELLSRYKDELKPYFTFVSVDADLHDRLSNKTSFYELCAQYDLPHPLTFVLDKAGAAAASITTCRSASPWPSSRRTASNTCTWTSPDARSVHSAHARGAGPCLSADLRRRLRLRADHPGLHPRLRRNMRVLNAYVDHDHHVRMMVLGHVLLADPTPEAIGNYAAIIPDYNEDSA